MDKLVAPYKKTNTSQRKTRKKVFSLLKGNKKPSCGGLGYCLVKIKLSTAGKYTVVSVPGGQSFLTDSSCI